MLMLTYVLAERAQDAFFEASRAGCTTNMDQQPAVDVELVA